MHTPTPAINTAALYFTDRLTKALASIAAKPLTLVEAPMGYGKTMAVREFLRGRKTRAVWVSVLDRGEDSFWRDFCRALAQAFPRNADITESLLRLGYPRDAARMAAARGLLTDLDFGRDTVLVIDDIHLLPESANSSGNVPTTSPGGSMGRLCALLARQGVAGLRIVLISRDTWNGEREILDLKGQLAVIGRDIFALTAPEIQAYYEACGVPLCKREAAALHKATGGWISALYLYLLRYSKQGVSRPALSSSSSESGAAGTPGREGAPLAAVNTLLEKEVFALLPAGAADLLLALYPLERFSLEQAEFLSGGAGSGNGAAAILADLQGKNSFINHNEADGTFALHSLFRQYLGGLFAALPQERRQAVHRKCADWFIQREDASSAIEACYAAGDYERALTVLESDMSRNLVTEKSRFFVDLFTACPEEIRNRHMGAAFKYAFALFSAGDFPGYGRQLAWIAERCAAMPEDDPLARALRGELELMFSLAAYNDIEAMSRHHRRANELLGRPTRLFGPESPWTLGCPSVLFMFHRTGGKLETELAQMRECLPHYYTLAAHHGAGGEWLMRAEALYNAGNFQEAAIVCHRAEAMARHYNQTGNVLCALFLRLRLHLAEGEYEKARDLARAMRETIRERRDYFMLHTVDLCEGYLAAALDRTDEVPEWLRFSGEQEKRLYTFAGGFYYIVHGRALLAEKEYAACIGLFEWLLQAGPFARHQMFGIYAYIYIAAASAALGRGAEAGTALKTALDMALPDDIFMPFAENADFLEPLLRGLRHEKLGQAKPGRAEEDSAGLAAVTRLAAAWEKSRRGILARHFSATVLPLTGRELQLARLAADGKKYKEIAEELHLAPTTVKKAFAVMLKKLGLGGREELRAYLRDNDPA